ncbi:MAG: hypothetical protein QXR44_03830 [Thermoproteota archaeon]
MSSRVILTILIITVLILLVLSTLLLLNIWRRREETEEIQIPQEESSEESAERPEPTFTPEPEPTPTPEAREEPTVLTNNSKMIQFYLPWDDGENTVVSLSSMLDKPAGRLGHVYIGDDGHLYVNESRIKFLGVNICGGASFPEKKDAEKIASRLAKFGVNIVRFHHMDADWESFNIFDRSFKDTRHLNEKALDRLDYFIAKLKENGVYVDLNLLVSRRFTSSDGLPREIDSVDWKDQQVLGFFMEEVEGLEKEYAKQLLTHFNPYTGKTYAEEPAVAFIEIVNEQGLIHSWLGGVIDKLPEVFKSRLRSKWNYYLLLKYGSTDGLKSAWGSLREGESLERGTVEIVSSQDWVGRRKTYADSDWLEFLYRLEEDFFIRMRDFIREELGSKALVIGTISSSCSPASVMSKMDIVDTHAYWQHPQFPSTAWDPADWYVENKPMVNNPQDSTIVGLAVKNVLNKPHFVTEYGHPAPNMYDAEAVLTFATYAALQDWDGIFMFAYGSRNNWNSSKIRGFFDIDQHPAHMAMLIPAHLVFIRGDVKPANKLITVRLTRDDEINLLKNRQVWAWGLPDAKHAGLNPLVSLIHRVEVDVEGIEFSNFSSIKISGSIYRSDTGEVTWDTSDPSRGVIIANTSKSIALIGFSGGRKFALGTVIFEPGDSLLKGWSVLALSSLDDMDLEYCERALLVALGYVTNTGMGLKAYGEDRGLLRWSGNNLSGIEVYNGRITCNANWGSAPTLVEGVSVTISIKTNARVRVWALDNTGNRVREVQVFSNGFYKSFTIGPEFGTIWYEIIFER